MKCLDLAVSNHELAVYRSNQCSTEWRITFLYYAAVHAVNHVLFGDGKIPEELTHARRLKGAKKNKRLTSVASKFDALQDFSISARYLPDLHPMDEKDFDDALECTIAIFTAAGISLP